MDVPDCIAAVRVDDDVCCTELDFGRAPGRSGPPPLNGGAIMSKSLHRLTDLQFKNAAPGTPLADGGGLIYRATAKAAGK